MWEVREVKDDTEFFREAYKWYTDVAGFVRAMRDFGEAHDLESFLEEVGSGRAFRGDQFGVPQVLVYAKDDSDGRSLGRWEGHLVCARFAHPGLIEWVISFAKQELMREPCVIICGVLKKHRARASMLRRVGFVEIGVTEQQGVYRGRQQEMVYYVAGRV